MKNWIDSYLDCKDCGKHLACKFHVAWLIREMKEKNVTKVTDKTTCSGYNNCKCC